MHYLLMYEVGADYLQRRADYREEHLQLAWEAQARGELLLAGALADPVDGAVLLFEADSPKVVEDFAKADPYVVNGLVLKWQVRPWTTVVGDMATTPVR
ncbi:YciI-like protein [Aliidiomarina sp. Khilg15.8]